MLPFPAFYDPSSIATVYVERAALVAEAAKVYRTTHLIGDASKDKVRIAVFGIDPQVGFCTPGASLFVPGAVEDTRRAIEWIYGNLDRITQLHFSLDTHSVFQIFHPAWWVDANGEHPAPMTVIRESDVMARRYRPIAHEDECLEYVRKLEASGKYVLTIWPYHTLLGGVSHALVPALMEAAIFHALVRGTEPRFETKGTHPMTENYSVLAPEVREVGGQTVGSFNGSLLQSLMEFDRVYVFGQAKSHCVLSTLRDMHQHVSEADASLLRKIYVLDDAMSPVPAPPLDPLPRDLDFPRIAEEAFAELARAGMNFVKTTDPL